MEMYPYMKFMNPFPQQENQMQFQPCTHPNYEVIPPQLRGYPEGYPLYHPPWPTGGMNYPPQPYGCCNHNFFPPYCPPSMPYGHPPSHCCGAYPVPPGTHPCHLPPLHPTMAPSQFDYPKDIPRYQHCYSFPNNTCKEGNYLKMEDPQTEPKADVFKNSPYPIVLLPPDYLKGNIGGKTTESTCDKQEVFPKSVKAQEKFIPAEHQPFFVNGWLPVDFDKWKSSNQGDDSGREIHKDNEKPYFPLPFLYGPYTVDEMGRMEGKEVDVGKQSSQGLSSDIQTDRPLSLVPIDSAKNKSNEKIVVCEDPRIVEKKNGDDHSPMMQEKYSEGKKGEDSEGKKTAQNTVEVNVTSSKPVGNEARKTSGYGKRSSSAQQKSSKLPPVCLRVDPLPKKKNSCSPSKPSSACDGKDKAESSKGDTLAASPNGARISSDDVSTRNMPKEQATTEEQPKRKIKTIKVYDVKSEPGEAENSGSAVSNINNCSRSMSESRSTHPSPVKDQSNHIPCEKNGEKDSSKEVSLAEKVNESKRLELSEDEAAKIIQSAYRGYEGRKWEPLKKLKSIKTVQEEVVQLKKRIDDLESTLDDTVLDKSRTVIGETIMNLLLKLDSIQGLPSSARQVRKSVATDLMGLQEQLDAIAQRKTEKSIQSGSLTKAEKEVGKADCLCILESEAKESLGLESDSKIEEEGKSENHEDPPLIELSVDEENRVQKEDTPDVVDRYTSQLIDLLQNGGAGLNDKSRQDELSDMGDVELNVLDAQDPVISVQHGQKDHEAGRLVEEEVNYIPDMDPAKQQVELPLETPALSEANDYLQLEENENGDNYFSSLVPGIPNVVEVEKDDENRPGTGAEAPCHDASELNKECVNADVLSENPVTEPVQVCEVREHVQDLCLTNNEKACEVGEDVQDFLTYHEKACDPVPELVAESTQICSGCEELQDLTDTLLPEQNEITEASDTARCEEQTIGMDENYGIDPDETLEMQTSKLPAGPDQMFAFLCEQAEPQVNPEQSRVSVISEPKQTEREKLVLITPASRQSSLTSAGFGDADRNLIEENKILREYMEKLIEAGQEQLRAISSLSGKVKDIEKKLHRKRRVKRSRGRSGGGSSCLKMSHNPINEKPVALAI